MQDFFAFIQVTFKWKSLDKVLNDNCTYFFPAPVRIKNRSELIHFILTQNSDTYSFEFNYFLIIAGELIHLQFLRKNFSGSFSIRFSAKKIAKNCLILYNEIKSAETRYRECKK